MDKRFVVQIPSAISSFERKKIVNLTGSVESLSLLFWEMNANYQSQVLCPSGESTCQSPRSEFQRRVNHQTIITRKQTKERKWDFNEVRQLAFVLEAEGRKFYSINKGTRATNLSEDSTDQDWSK